MEVYADMGLSFEINKKLDHFTLDVKYEIDNELLVIEGPSGAGKTTILNCIAGIVAADSSSIILAGKAISHLPIEKRHIGYLFQNYALFPHMTVEENVLYGLKNSAEYKDKTKRRELLDFASYTMETLGIAHLANKFPQAVSGGEKQRAALARAMVTRPSLLMLDEPFSALDEETKENIYEEFARFKSTLDIPTILITHDHRETELFADKHITLKEGRII
ncbi:MAG: ATP-binding cassette domain-containing protein [Bacillota bacterium]|nr:ATP-binding cassette domain-containing protein [Bacillota bacterium]